MAQADHHRETISQIVGELRAERERKGWSMYKLANTSGVSAPAISLIETGQREPNLVTLLLLSHALQLRLGDILNRFDAPRC